MSLDKLDIPNNKKQQLRDNNINSLEDILKYIPHKYYDFRKITSIRDIKDNEVSAIVGIVEKVQSCKGNMYYAKVRDNTGSILINWFGSKYNLTKLKEGTKYIFCGKGKIDKKFHNIKKMSLMFFDENINKYQKMIPLYKKIKDHNRKNMSNDYLEKIIKQTFSIINQKDYLEDSIRKKFNLTNEFLAFKYLHQPRNPKELELAKKRILFDDLFAFSYKINSIKTKEKHHTEIIPTTCKYWKNLIDNLSFEMTEDQKHTIKDIFIKMRKGKKINALIQGDVGTGKTIIAIFLMLVFAENDFQSCLMAPTEILARQHYEEIKERFKEFPFNVVFLCSKMKSKEKKDILKQIKSGEAHLIIGTHAIISNSIEFSNLGLTIIDEQHKFGVIQRNMLKNKAGENPHNIMLSATPIPRTLTMALYGNLIDIYTIKSKPKGRKKIKTIKILENKDIYKFMYSEIRKGRQCYIVCPLIEDSESDKMKDVESVDKVYQSTKNYFDKSNINISFITGKMKKEDIRKEIDKFKNNENQILISTTIIEVGINIPNVSTIIIKNANRFGLAQLHQLRGRVGRSNIQSYCILQSTKENDKKIEIMCKTNDGFVIAEEDMKLRGTGEFLGTRQSGDNKYVNLMLLNQNLYRKIDEIMPTIISNKKYKSLKDINM